MGTRGSRAVDDDIDTIDPSVSAKVRPSGSSEPSHAPGVSSSYRALGPVPTGYAAMIYTNTDSHADSQKTSPILHVNALPDSLRKRPPPVLSDDPPVPPQSGASKISTRYRVPSEPTTDAIVRFAEPSVRFAEVSVPHVTARDVPQGKVLPAMRSFFHSPKSKKPFSLCRLDDSRVLLGLWNLPRIPVVELRYSYSPDVDAEVVTGEVQRVLSVKSDWATASLDGSMLGLHVFSLEDPSSDAPKTHVLAGCSDNRAKLWDLRKNDADAPVAQYCKDSEHENWVWCALYCRSRGYVVTLTGNNRFRAYDIETGTFVRGREQAHSDQIYAGTIARFGGAGGEVLVSGAEDCRIKIWDFREASDASWSDSVEPMVQLRGRNRIAAIAQCRFAEHVLVVREMNEGISVWDIRKLGIADGRTGSESEPTPVLRFSAHHCKEWSDAGWSLKGNLLEVDDGLFVTSGFDGGIRKWRIDGKIQQERRFADMEFGQVAVVGSWDFEGGEKSGWHGEELEERLGFVASCGFAWDVRLSCESGGSLQLTCGLLVSVLQ